MMNRGLWWRRVNDSIQQLMLGGWILGDIRREDAFGGSRFYYSLSCVGDAQSYGPYDADWKAKEACQEATMSRLREAGVFL